MTDILRTPPERFAAVPGFPYLAHARSDLPGYAGLSMAYIDEGPASAPVFLCLHGQPTWSYLYRRMIPHFLAAGGRVVAPDFFGFGRSDKPAEDAVYTFDFHRHSLIALVSALDLENITLVVQDWGGLLGLTLPMEMPQRFRRLIVMNTALPGGEVPLPKGFLDWRAFSNSQPDMAIGRLMARACPHLTAAEVAAYDAPFPDAAYKAGVRRFPNLVPEFPDSDGAAIERAARDFWRTAWNGESVMAIGMADPVLGAPVMRTLHGDPLRGDSISARAHAAVGIFSRKVYPCLYDRAARGRKPLASSQQLIETFPRPRTASGRPKLDVTRLLATFRSGSV